MGPSKAQAAQDAWLRSFVNKHTYTHYTLQMTTRECTILVSDKIYPHKIAMVLQLCQLIQLTESYHVRYQVH